MWPCPLAHLEYRRVIPAPTSRIRVASFERATSDMQRACAAHLLGAPTLAVRLIPARSCLSPCRLRGVPLLVQGATRLQSTDTGTSYEDPAQVRGKVE